MFLKVTLALVLIGISSIFQASLFFGYNYTPHFTALVIIYFALKEGSFFGQWIGFLGGIIFDFLSIAPLGFYTTQLLILGYIVGLFYKKIEINSVIIIVFFTFFSLIVNYIVLFLLSYAFTININIPYIWANSFWFTVLSTSILAPFLFFLFNEIYIKFFEVY